MVAGLMRRLVLLGIPGLQGPPGSLKLRPGLTGVGAGILLPPIDFMLLPAFVAALWFGLKVLRDHSPHSPMRRAWELIVASAASNIVRSVIGFGIPLRLASIE